MQHTVPNHWMDKLIISLLRTARACVRRVVQMCLPMMFLVSSIFNDTRVRPCHTRVQVRLLRPDVEPTAQTAAAAALSLLASRDMVIQDSVRYLGGIELLVDLLASPDAYLSEVARCGRVCMCAHDGCVDLLAVICV